MEAYAPPALSTWAMSKFSPPIKWTRRRHRALVFVLSFLVACFHQRRRLDNFIVRQVLPVLLSWGGRAIRLLDTVTDRLLLKDNDGGRCFRWRSEPRPFTWDFRSVYLPSPKRTKKKKRRMLAPPTPQKSDFIRLSFSGCSWCVFYHLGVAECFLER